MTMADRIKVPAAFWLGVDRLGIRRSELLRTAGLPVVSVRNDCCITTLQFFALWRAMETLHGQDAGIRLAHALDGSVLPPSFLVGHHARDLADALRRVARFKALCAPEELSVVAEGDRCILALTWPHAGASVPAALTDASMTSLLDLARTGTGEDIRPVRLELRRGPSDAISSHFRCPVRWGAELDRLILRRSDLDVPFRTYNQELLEMLDTALDAEMKSGRAAGTMADKVRWFLRRNLTAGRPELRSIARELAISERSLQRRLGEEGHSFQSLLSETRHLLACEYLAQPLDIAEIAYLLGYDDQGSFFRAFQKWEGKTPSEWRQASV